MRYSQAARARQRAANRHLRPPPGVAEAPDDTLTRLVETLLRSRDLLRTIFDQVNDGFALVGLDRRVLAANVALARLYGTTPARLVGSVLSPEHPVSALLSRALEARRALVERHQLCDAAGNLWTLDIQLTPLANADMQVEQVVIHIIDASQQALAGALALENVQLASSRRLAGSVAHMLNTPLQALQNYLYLIGEHGDPDERGRLLERSNRELDRMALLVSRMLEFQQEESTQQLQLSVDDLVERTLLVTGGQLQRLRVNVSCDLGPGLPLLFCDGDHLLMAMVNLVMYAAETIQGDGALQISARGQETGGGKPAAIRIEVARTGRPQPAGGAGGPAVDQHDGRIELSRHILEKFGGVLTLAHRVDGGRSAVITLPLALPAPVPAI